jgi:excisionase family DNA binding protein
VSAPNAARSLDAAVGPGTAINGAKSPSAISPNAAALTVELTLTAEQVDAIAQRAAEILAARQVPTASPWLSVAEAAERLRCGKDRIYDLIALGRLQPRRDGRRVLLRTTDLDAYLEGS